MKKPAAPARQPWLSRKTKIILVTVVVTTVVVILGLNFVPHEKQVKRQIVHQVAVDSGQFRREMSHLLGPAIIDGNQVIALANGDQIFPSMLEAIRGAQRSITFETYIYWSGTIGQQFADALTERARAGVKVHILLDWVGSVQMDATLINALTEAGCEVERFHPLRWYTIGRMNNRTHRKTLVVDGRIGFTGGVGIADQWLGNAQDPKHWRDTHFRVEGPVVAQMQAVFIDNWITTTGHVLQGEPYFPALESPGTMAAQMFSSSPDGGSESMQLMFLMAIAGSTRTLDIAASYVVPDALTIDVMVSALQRGVRVRMIVPGEHIDTPLVRKASRANWGPLLRAGAQLCEYAPTMFHNKIMIVDSYLTLVGSTNFDNRSFTHNDEANLNVYDYGFAGEMTTMFENDVKQCRVVSYAEWQDRSRWTKVQDWFWNLFSSQL